MWWRDFIAPWTAILQGDSFGRGEVYLSHNQRQNVQHQFILSFPWHWLNLQKKGKKKNHNQTNQPTNQAKHNYLNNKNKKPNFLSQVFVVVRSPPHTLPWNHSMSSGSPIGPQPLCDELDCQASLGHMGTPACLSWEHPSDEGQEHNQFPTYSLGTYPTWTTAHGEW